MCDAFAPKRRPKTYRYSLYDPKCIANQISRHVFVPKHENISLFERNRVLKEYRITKHKLPSIKFSDPQVVYHGFKVGSIIKITRTQATSGETPFYRYVESDTIDSHHYAISEFTEEDNLYKEVINVLNKTGNW